MGGVISGSATVGGAIKGCVPQCGEPGLSGFLYKYKTKLRRYMKDAAQGAATSVYAAVSSAEWEGKGGRYLSDCVVQGRLGRGRIRFFVVFVI
jgi:hypothetical protein